MTAEDLARKARGAFFTPPEIAQFLVDWAVRSPSDAVLEPSCGDASFLLPAAERLRALGSKNSEMKLHGVDIHLPSLRVADERLKEQGFRATLSQSDFFDSTPASNFDAVVGNPPFIRYQDFSGSSRTKGLKAALSHGVRLSSLASSWAAFTIHASEFLKSDGRLALVLPAELLSVNYASAVRRFLLNRFSKVSLVLFERLVFPGILEDVVLLLAEGRGSADRFEVFQARDATSLATLDTSRRQGFTPLANEKWTPALIPTLALDTYREITKSRTFGRLSDWGETSLGSVTGNNTFFTLSAADIARYGFSASEVTPISPPGSRHLHGLTFSEHAWHQQVKDGAACYLFTPKASRQSKAARTYISQGERNKVHKAYKCAIRDPWWDVPLLDRPDLFFTYMNHDRPRLIANAANVRILNSLYGVKLRQGLKTLGKAALPIACLNTVTLLGSEVVGRAYGGGLLKHEPREADLLPVPSAEILASANEDLQLLKPQLAIALRSNNLLQAVAMVDAVILEKHLKLEPEQISQLRGAREMLFDRRRSRGKNDRGTN